MATQISLNDGAIASAGALAIQTNGTTQAVSISTGQVATLAQNPILTSGTANGVAYLNGSKVLTTGSALVFDGTNLGLGAAPTTSWPAGRPVIEINGTTTGNLAFNGNNTNGYQIWMNSYYNGSVSVYKYNGFANNCGGGGDGSFFWNLAASGTAGNTVTFTQAMTLDASGRLGIGTTSPSNPLHIVSNTVSQLNVAALSGNTNAQINLEPTGTGIALIGPANSVAFAFRTNATERMRLDSSGNLLVGTTSAPTGGAVSTWQNAGSSRWSMGPNGGSAFVVFNTSNVGVYVVDGQTGWTGTSDGTLKNVIAPITNGLSSISALKPTIYSWKSDEENIPYAGLIAQEVQTVLPNLVNDNNGTLGVNYTGLIPYLISSIQEQQALITQLQADVAALKGA